MRSLLAVLIMAGQFSLYGQARYDVFISNRQVIYSGVPNAIKVRSDVVVQNGHGLMVVKSKPGVTGSKLFFIAETPNGHHLVRVDSLPEDYLYFDILGYDFDGDGVQENVVAFVEESTFYVSVFRWVRNGTGHSVTADFKTEELGIPEKWNGRKLQVDGGSMNVYFQRENGAHNICQLQFQEGRYRLQDVDE